MQRKTQTALGEYSTVGQIGQERKRSHRKEVSKQRKKRKNGMRTFYYTEQIEEAEAKEKAAKEVLAKHDLRAETFKMISKEVAAETKSMKSVAVPVTNLFGSEEYVKVKKSDWNKMLDAFNKAVSRNHLLEKYEKKISSLEKKIATLTDQVEKLKRFVTSRGLGEAFVEFVKSLAPQTMKQKLGDAKANAAEHNRQRKMNQQKLIEKDKHWQQEM